MSFRSRRLRLCCLLLCLACLPGDALGQGGFEGRFPDGFLQPGESPGWDGWVYRSESLYISVTLERFLDSDVFTADIYIWDLSQLRRGYGGGQWGARSRKISAIAENEGAVLALTGDNSRSLSQGPVFGNGVLLRASRNRKRQLCVIGTDGVMRILSGKDLTEQDIRAMEGSV